MYRVLKRLNIPLEKRTKKAQGQRLALSPTSIKNQLLRLLQHAYDTDPKTPVSLSNIARTLGVPRQRVHTLYHQLAAEYVLPPVAKPGFGQLDRETRLAIAKLGGEAVHAKGTAHRLTENESKRAWQNSLLKRTQTRNSKLK